MNFIVPFHHFNTENVQFLKIKKNIVMENSFFIKIIYSDENIVLNGIYLDVPLTTATAGVQNNSFFFFDCDETENRKIIAKLVEMENDILQYYQFITPVDHEKHPVYLLKTQLERGSLKWGFSKKPFPKKIRHICLKISGIWENEREYGINYKFLPI